MKVGGWALAVLGVLLIVIGLTIEVGVRVGYVPSSPYLPSPPSQVANLHKMHIQALVIQGGFAAMICGSILGAAGVVIDALREGRTSAPEQALTPAQDEAPPTPEPAEPVTEATGDNLVNWLIGSVVLIILAALIVAGVISGSRQTRSGDALNDAVLNEPAPMENLDMPAESMQPLEGNVVPDPSG